MLVKSSRFGEQEVDVSKIIDMPEGMLGFADEKRYVLLTPPKRGPFLWFQAVDNPDLAFVLIDAKQYFSDYTFKLTAEEFRALELDEKAEVIFMLVVTMAPDPSDITVNLQGPIVINTHRLLAKQLVLDGEIYPTRHPFLDNVFKSN